jgi:hypothetical protein
VVGTGQVRQRGRRRRHHPPVLHRSADPVHFRSPVRAPPAQVGRPRRRPAHCWDATVSLTRPAGSSATISAARGGAPVAP